MGCNVGDDGSHGRSKGESEKILFFIYQIGSGTDGGVSSITEIIMRFEGGSPVIVTNKESRFSRQWREIGDVHVWGFYEGGYSEKSSRYLKYFARLLNNIRTFLFVLFGRFRVVHFNDPSAFVNGAIGAKFGGANIVLNVRDGMREGASSSKWRAFLKMSDRFLVLSSDMADHWRLKLGPLSKRDIGKFIHIYSVVDLEKFSPCLIEEKVKWKFKLGLSLDAKVVMYVGRFEKKKAQLDFIRKCLPVIIGQCADCLMIFLGDFSPGENGYARLCYNAVSELGLSKRVRFVGHADNVDEWYRASDLLVLASEREGLARCMIEGISSGVPMVSFDVCSAREILECRDCGIVVRGRDYDKLASEVARLINDDAERLRLGKNGRSAAEALFEAKTNVSMYESLLGELSPKHE